MRLGIKRKVLLVLVGSLVLTTALHALLASHFTDRQNEASAFALLRLELLAWQNELQDLTLHLKDAALAAVGDAALLSQMAELVALEFEIEDTITADPSRQTERTLAYLKSVSINRLHLVLRTSGFSSISLYTRGKLSHHVSATEAGMKVRWAESEEAWVAASIDEKGDLPVTTWPAWRASDPPPAHSMPQASRPTVSFDFSDPELTTIEIAVPVQGVIEEILNESDVKPTGRYVSDVAVAGLATARETAGRSPSPGVFAVVVFRRVIGHAELERVAAKTGKLPTMLSPRGDHLQQLSDLALPVAQAARAAHPIRPGRLPVAWHGVVQGDEGSYYAAYQPWFFEDRPALILGLAASRDTTLQNIRETVAALLAATGLILLLSLAAGTLLIGRLINPVVALTSQVKAIGLQGRSGARLAGGDARSAPEWLKPVDIGASDEVGELTEAFNVMVGELRGTLETLEQRVQMRTAELRQQTRYLRTLIDTLPMMVWLKDTEGRYLAVNQANADVCGRTVDEIVGKTDLDLWPREVAEAYRQEDAQIMASRHRRTVEEAHVSGTVWIETYQAPVLDEDGTVLGTAGAARDISERKAAETAREAALTEAERLARVRSEFLAQMSHELRTPLNGILGYAQILRRDRTLSQKQIDGLNVIQKSGEHLLMLINDVLDLSRIEAGRLDLFPTDFGLQRFLLVIAEIVRVKAREKQLAFFCDFAPDLPARICADEKRLRQILLNLLANAIKFTDQGEVTLRVRYEPPSRLCFQVQDTGIGIAGDQWEAIFQPFEQTGEARRRMGGAGLGLAISRQLARLMGGDIRVDSRLGQGSIFWFALDVVVKPGEAEVAPADGLVTGYLGPRKTILVVDDLPENRRMAMDMLAPLGFTLLEAGDGCEGLEQARTGRPDLILMDVVMPGMDGLEATRRLRRIEGLAETPVVAVSASASGNDVDNSLAAGANAFLPKPLDLGRLLESLGSLLQLEWSHEPLPCAARDDPAPETLEPPPPEEMRVLHRLALQGSMRDIAREADRLIALDERYRPFASRLRRLAEEYQSKAVLRFVTHYMERTGP